MIQKIYQPRLEVTSGTDTINAWQDWGQFDNVGDAINVASNLNTSSAGLTDDEIKNGYRLNACVEVINAETGEIINIIEIGNDEEDDPAFEADQEVVNIWIKKFKKSGSDYAGEIEEIEGTISNENIWMHGSSSEEEIQMHMQNIADLTAYLAWLKDNKR